MIDIVNAKKVFKEYVSNYDITDGKIALKVAHILRVAELSKQIANSLDLSEEDVELAEDVMDLAHGMNGSGAGQLFEDIFDFDEFSK